MTFKPASVPGTGLTMQVDCALFVTSVASFVLLTAYPAPVRLYTWLGNRLVPDIGS